MPGHAPIRSSHLPFHLRAQSSFENFQDVNASVLAAEETEIARQFALTKLVLGNCGFKSLSLSLDPEPTSCSLPDPPFQMFSDIDMTGGKVWSVLDVGVVT